MIPKTTFQFVDVRDVALAHAAALTTPGASNKRYLAVGGCNTAASLVSTLASIAPDAKLPTEEEHVRGCCQSVDCLHVLVVWVGHSCAWIPPGQATQLHQRGRHPVAARLRDPSVPRP